MESSQVKLKIVKPVNNDWTLQELLKENTPSSWSEVFKSCEHELKEISDILNEDKKNGKRLPYNTDIFRIFHLVKPQDVRIILCGMDPYHGIVNEKPQAMGMSFSVPKGFPIPSSLRNIFKELKNTVKDFNTPNHGDLTKWALQGIFLMNACLTVREGTPGSHGEIWAGFIKKVLNTILEINPNCIILLWGNDAKKLKKLIGNRGVILEAAHPSGLSANRGFFGCNHFNKINEILLERKQTPIDWNL